MSGDERVQVMCLECGGPSVVKEGPRVWHVDRQEWDYAWDCKTHCADCRRHDIPYIYAPVEFNASEIEKASDDVLRVVLEELDLWIGLESPEEHWDGIESQLYREGLRRGLIKELPAYDGGYTRGVLTAKPAADQEASQ
jgi:hypothetical protein